VAHLPAWADVLSRGPHLVCTALGLRLAPIAILLVMRAYAATPRSWTLAAALHGISLKQFSMNVLLPALLPALALSGLTIALLSNVDVTTVLILHPPGLASLPLAIFTVMANAPEYLVASLCLAYVGIAAAALTALWALAARVEHG
jgi:ABC-type Fe3+ transport system permease subunit